MNPGECCDTHGRNCEPPGDLCCELCTEARHGGWTDGRGNWRYGHPHGEQCSNPDLSAPEPDYIVLRAWPQAPPGWLPPGMEGSWHDRSGWPSGLPGTPAPAVVHPTGRFEFRAGDGACAEVWEVRPADLA